jgi:hypothetical protein
MAKKADIVKTVSSAEVLNKVQYAITILRGKQVLLDFQLAALYGVETKRLNEAVKRNIQRFPEDFMFRVTKEELSSIRSQFATTYLQLPDNGTVNNVISRVPNEKRTASALPYAFTEQGVAMLSSVLRSETAVQVNIAIMRAFVMARQIVTETRENALAINELRMKMKMLEDALENNLGAVNDLSEEMRAELDNIYNAIGALSVKYQDPPKPKMNPIGYEATAARYEEEKRSNNKLKQSNN